MTQTAYQEPLNECMTQTAHLASFSDVYDPDSVGDIHETFSDVYDPDTDLESVSEKDAAPGLEVVPADVQNLQVVVAVYQGLHQPLGAVVSQPVVT